MKGARALSARSAVVKAARKKKKYIYIIKKKKGLKQPYYSGIVRIER